ncbi:hypothetical protein JCM11641_000356 [Rhodosporidiobolus odoratus]
MYRHNPNSYAPPSPNPRWRESGAFERKFGSGAERFHPNKKREGWGMSGLDHGVKRLRVDERTRVDYQGVDYGNPSISSTHTQRRETRATAMLPPPANGVRPSRAEGPRPTPAHLPPKPSFLPARPPAEVCLFPPRPKPLHRPFSPTPAPPKSYAHPGFRNQTYKVDLRAVGRHAMSERTSALGPSQFRPAEQNSFYQPCPAASLPPHYPPSLIGYPSGLYSPPGPPPQRRYSPPHAVPCSARQRFRPAALPFKPSLPAVVEPHEFPTITPEPIHKVYRLPAEPAPPASQQNQPLRFSYASSSSPSPNTVPASSPVDDEEMVFKTPPPAKLYPGDPNPGWLEEGLYGPAYGTWEPVKTKGEMKDKVRGRGRKKRALEGKDGEEDPVGHGVDWEGWEERRGRKRARR